MFIAQTAIELGKAGEKVGIVGERSPRARIVHSSFIPSLTGPKRDIMCRFEARPL